MTDHHALQELLGSYSLDAVDPDEARAVEAHLEVCARCRQELAEYREVTSLLSYPGGEAPPGVWDRIAAGMHDGAPERNLDRIGVELLAEVRDQGSGRALVPRASRMRPVDDTRRHRPSWQAPAAWLAAAAVAAAAVLGAEVAHLDGRLSHVEQAAATAPATMSDVRAALSVPGHREMTLRGPGSASLSVVMLPSGIGYVYHPHLRPLPSDRTYQLWGVVGSQAISYGLLGPRPTVEEFRAGSGVRALAVTDEVGTGVVVGHQPFSVSGAVPPAAI